MVFILCYISTIVYINTAFVSLRKSESQCDFHKFFSQSHLLVALDQNHLIALKPENKKQFVVRLLEGDG